MDDRANRSEFIGISFAVAGNICVSLGLNVQRYAHVRLAEQDEERRDESTRPGERHSRSRYTGSRIWWLGFLLMAIGECGNFLAYGWTSAMIVAPLGTVALVSNVIFAPVLLHEHLGKRNLLGVSLSICGAVLICLSSSGQEEKTLDPHILWYLITQLSFKIYLCITLLAIIIFLPLSRKYGDKVVLIDLMLVALFGGYTVLSTKAISTLLSLSLIRIFTFPIFYLLAAVLVSTAILQIKFLNQALQHFHSTTVLPIQFVLFTISVIIGSAVLYKDFAERKSQQIIVFFVGCILTFLGIYFISSTRKDSIWSELDDPSKSGHLETSPLLSSIDVTLEHSYTRRSSTLSASNIFCPVQVQSGSHVYNSSQNISESVPRTDAAQSSSFIHHPGGPQTSPSGNISTQSSYRSPRQSFSRQQSSESLHITDSRPLACVLGVSLSQLPTSPRPKIPT